MKASERVRLGTRGERYAAHALQAAGYQILARRWRIPGGEIDLIAQDEAGFAFVEVKTQGYPRRGPPEDAVTPRKLQLLHRAAQQWLGQHVGDEAVSWRVDVVAVELDRARIPYRITIFQFFS